MNESQKEFYSDALPLNLGSCNFGSFCKLTVRCTLEVLAICSELDKNELFLTSFASLLFMIDLEFSTFDSKLSNSLGLCKFVLGKLTFDFVLVLSTFLSVAFVFLSEISAASISCCMSPTLQMFKISSSILLNGGGFPFSAKCRAIDF